MATQHQKERRAISRKRNILNFLLVGIIGIGTGLFLGSWYSYAFLSSSVDYSNISEATLRDDIDEIFKKAIKKNKITDSDKENWVSTAKSQGVTPKNLTTYENIALAEYNLENAQSYAVTGTGLVDTVVKQTVYSAKYYDGNQYVFENISKSSMVTVANCFVLNKGANLVSTIAGNNVTETSANWTGSKTEITTSEFSDKNGVLPNKVIPYIVSSKTVTSSSEITETTVNGIKQYKFSVNLDSINSVIHYVRQVKQTGGLSDYPTFNDIKLTFVIDENWNFVSFDVVENYRVVYAGLKPKCTGTLNLTFKINEPITLPEHN